MPCGQSVMHAAHSITAAMTVLACSLLASHHAKALARLPATHRTRCASVGLGSPRPHLRRDWARPSHICAGTICAALWCWIPCNNQACKRPCVVYLHGNSGSRVDALECLQLVRRSPASLYICMYISREREREKERERERERERESVCVCVYVCVYVYVYVYIYIHV